MNPRDTLRAVARAARRCPACASTNAENRRLRERLETAEARLADQHEINGRLLQGAAEQDVRIKKYKAGEYSNSRAFTAVVWLLGQALHDARKARAELAGTKATIARLDATNARLSSDAVAADNVVGFAPADAEGGEAA